MNKLNLKEKLSSIADYWNPRIVGELNGQRIKLVKFEGEFASINTTMKTKCL